MAVLEVAARCAERRVAQPQVGEHRGAAEVEHAVAEAQLLARRRRARVGARLGDGKGELPGDGVEDGDGRRRDLDGAGREARVGVAPRADRARRGDDPLGAQTRGLRRKRGRRRGVDHDLRDARVVADVQKQEPAEVARAVDPAAEGHLRAEVARSKFAAGVGSKHGMHLFPRGPVPPAPAGGAGVAR